MSRQGDDHLVSRFSHAFPQVFSFILKNTNYSKKSLDFDHFFVHKQQLPGPEGEAVRELFAQRRILILARLLEKLLTAHKVYIYIYVYVACYKVYQQGSKKRTVSSSHNGGNIVQNSDELKETCIAQPFLNLWRNRKLSVAGLSISVWSTVASHVAWKVHFAYERHINRWTRRAFFFFFKKKGEKKRGGDNLSSQPLNSSGNG